MTFLLVTDLDNTLAGDAQATLALNQKLTALRDRVCLIYATGRSYASACQLKRDAQLLEPDYWITGVGTEIYQDGNRDAAWANHLSQHWHRETIASIAQSVNQLVPQPDSEQNPWKLSYFLKSTTADEVLGQLRSKLAQAGMVAQVVFSSNRDVDVLPSYGDKGLAMSYLRDRLNRSPEDTLVCGDSGNDISLFRQPAFGVIVRNAQPELLTWYRQHRQSRHYLACSTYAWGILEALFHFKFIPS